MRRITNPDATTGDIVDAMNANIGEITAYGDGTDALVFQHAQVLLLARAVDRLDELLELAHSGITVAAQR